MPMKKDLLIRIEFQNQVDYLVGLIDTKHRKDEMFEITEFEPANVMAVELMRHLFLLPADLSHPVDDMTGYLALRQLRSVI